LIPGFFAEILISHTFTVKRLQGNHTSLQLFLFLQYMSQRLGYITVLVDDYDKAIDFYVNKLHFTLVEDSVISETKRWVLVRPAGEYSCCLLLAKAANTMQKNFIGNQTGGRVFLFLLTDDFERDYRNLIDNRIAIEREPKVEPYGTVAVFRDIYGNLWDLIGPTAV
jgi:catechol 2,3-dioxygenase-like lactoylglutathione lyase family enzyme